jgi:hypothetical protein
VNNVHHNALEEQVKFGYLSSQLIEGGNSYEEPSCFVSKTK